MSSSQDSDVDLQCQRIIKPKKLVTRFNCSLFSIESTRQQTAISNISLCTGKNDPQITLTQSSSQTDSNSNQPEKYDINLHPDVCFFTVRQNKNFTFDLDIQKKQEPIHKVSSVLKNQRKSGETQLLKVKFQLIDSEKEDQSVQNPVCTSKKQIRQRNRKMTKSCRSPLQIEKLNNRLKKTTPVYSSNMKKSQAIREYVKDGNKIRTNWVKNIMNGYTEIDYYDSGKLRGIFNQGDLVQGQMTFPNKFVYSGKFSAFTFHGPGTLKFPSGQIFEGNWINGYLQGKGKIRYPKGQIYCGDISNFRRQGQGYLYFNNGDKYVGQFTQGQITGYGEFHRGGQVTHKGFWVNGKFLGEDLKKFQEQKMKFIQEQRSRRQVNKSKMRILQESLKKIYRFHESMNDTQSNTYLTSEARMMNLSILESTRRFLEQDCMGKSVPSNHLKKKEACLSIQFI